MARARTRRDPAQGLAQGRRAVRALRRVAVLVRRSAERIPWRAAPRAGTGPVALLELRPLRRRARPSCRVPPLRRRRHATGIRRRGRCRAALPRHPPGGGRELTPRRLRLPRQARPGRRRRDAAERRLPRRRCDRAGTRRAGRRDRAGRRRRAARGRPPKPATHEQPAHEPPAHEPKAIAAEPKASEPVAA